MVEKLGNKDVLPFRQIEILVYMALGCSYEETAHFLGISRHTFRTYLYQVLEELGAKGRAHAVVLSLLKGFLDLNTLEQLESPKELETDWTLKPLIKQILTLVALGYNNKDIGQVLNYSEQHIRNIVHVISDELGARNRVHLITLSLMQRKLDFQGLRMDMAIE
jgi:DNA-binding CsgD family transcriptional regulator